MKTRLTILLFIISCTTLSVDGKAAKISGDSTIKVLVLPPYDLIANAGTSPDTQGILEKSLTRKTNLSVIPFPYKKLMQVPYQMVYDKKYCKPITDKVDCDIIIMTQIITKNEREPGSWPWAYKIRVYNVKTGRQLNSIEGSNLKSEDFSTDINSKIEKLRRDIELSSQIR